MKPLAKSLHTVTVLVAIARDVLERMDLVPAQNAEYAVTYAVGILGLEEAPDVYGLRAQAIAKLNKGV